jgi:HSP20 family protein
MNNLTIRNRPVDLEPMDEFDQLERELSRWFDFGFDQMGLFDREFAPRLDLLETDDSYILTVELPGIDKKDLNVAVENNVLTIEGEKKYANKEKKRFFRKEIWEGSFRRTISLPTAADPNKVKAELKDGLLTIILGKKEEHKPRQITVSVQ